MWPALSRRPSTSPASLSGLTVADVDVFEINEAFASQVGSTARADGLMVIIGGYW